VNFPDWRRPPQRTVIAQVAAAVFGGSHSVGFFYMQATTALILVLAANTAFNGFPATGAILAQTRTCPGSCTPGATDWLQQRHLGARNHVRPADLHYKADTTG